MARGLLGADHPLLFRHKRREALREADLVLLAGVPCDFRLDYGRAIGRQARIVAANLDAAELTRNRAPSVASCSDPGAFLARPVVAASGSRRRAPIGCAGCGSARPSEKQEIARTGGASPPPEASTRCSCCASSTASSTRRRPRRRRRRLRRHRLLHRAARSPLVVARPRTLRDARRRRRLRRRSEARAARLRGLGPLRRRLARLQPDRVRHLRAPRPPGHRAGRQRRLLGADRARSGRGAGRRRGHRARAHRLPRRGGGAGWPGSGIDHPEEILPGFAQAESGRAPASRC